MERIRQLDDIHTMIADSQCNSPADSKRVAVYGMPGAGKSQLLLKFAKDHKAANPECNVFHVDATERETLLQGFEVMHALLSLPRESRQGVMIEVVKDWLTKNGGWLLLIDNVFSSNVVKPFLPAGDSGTMLFTMRDELAARTLGTTGNLELTSMSTEESVELILKCAGMDLSTVIPDDRDLAAELCQEVGGLPLALDQSATCLSHRHWSLSKYVDLLRREKVETLKLYASAESSSNFYNTFILTLKHVDPVAVALLMLMAHLDHHNIPMKLLEVAIGNQISVLDVPETTQGSQPSEGKHGHTFTRLKPKVTRLLHRFHIERGHSAQKPSDTSIHANHADTLESRQYLKRLFSNSEELENAVSNLSQAALIGRKQGGNIWLHDLVYEISLNLIDSPERSLLSGVAVELCGLLFPWDVDNPENWGTCEEISTHVLMSLRQAEKLGVEIEEMYRLQFNLAYYYKERARYDDALKFFNASLDGYGKLLGSEHQNTLSGINGMAIVLDFQGRYNEALEWYERALDGMGKLHGRDHPLTLDIVHNMAFVFEKQARFDEALEWYERALAGCEKVLGKDHLSTLGTVNNIAIVFDKQMQYDEALKWYERALAGTEKILGKDHPTTLGTVNNMANVFKTQGRYDEAMEWYERALAGYEKVHGKDHPSVLDTVNQKAELFDMQERYEEAIEWFERALAGRSKILGLDHPKTKKTAGYLSKCKIRIEELRKVTPNSQQ